VCARFSLYFRATERALERGVSRHGRCNAVFKIGVVSGVGVVLDDEPTLIATLDGFKTESVSVRNNGQIEVFAGTDDENYGGTMRLLPSQP